ncbi:unnamed protein product [Echinostoma caproni]|uniref:Uncharacterized protein n=1 Tax=Echinostoma caproni TaxID=27848 RepID=A0A182ZZL4_9TREM|nr:unnamed protein product [Echinostoma caproni]
MSGNLLADIRAWTANEFPGFVSCVNKLTQLNEPNARESVDLIRTLRERLHLLPDHLIRQLFEPMNDLGSWINCEKTVAKEVTQLLVSIAVHFNSISQDVIDAFVLFLFNKTDPMSDRPDHDEMLVVQFFQQLMKIAPQSERFVTERILNKFPGWRKPLIDILWPMLNSLYLFCSPSTSSFFSIASKSALFSQLCKLLIDLEFNLQDHPGELLSFVTSIEPLIDYDNFQSMRATICEFLTSETVSSTIDRNNTNDWVKLDLLTWLLSSHLPVLCAATDPKQKLDWPLLCAVFKQMRGLFAQHVLPVSSSSLNAFPLICSFTTTLRGGLMVSFAEFLWTSVKDEHKDIGSRTHALSFLTFLMARTNACFLDLVVELLHEMTGWCVDYVYKNRNRFSHTKVSDLVRTNSVYYAVCDSLFYTLVQLHASLFDSTYYRSSCDRLPLAQIILSPLDPLSHMKSNLRMAISMLVSAYNFGWGMIAVGLEQNSGTHLTVEHLQQLEPSNFFTLPFTPFPFRFSQPILSRLVRPYSLGKPIQAVTDSSSESELPARKRRKVPNGATQGLDVTKLSRIINGT